MPTLNSPLSEAPLGSTILRIAEPPQAAPRALGRSGLILAGRYQLRYPLGVTDGLTIYDAVDLDNGRRVAIRLLAERRRGARERYLVETRVATEVQHPNIVEILAFGHDVVGVERLGYVVMEYLQGESLSRTLEFDGPMRWTQVLTIAKQVCSALIAAHRQSIIHANLTLANCFRVFHVDGPDVIKVMNFGGARFPCKQTGLCPQDGAAGEPGAVAPELLAGHVFDARVDIYALGHLMYRLTTVRQPYPETAGAASWDRTDESRRTAPVPPRVAVPDLEMPPEFEAVVCDALALDPQLRPVDAQAMYDRLVGVEQLTGQSSRLPRDPVGW